MNVLEHNFAIDGIDTLAVDQSSLIQGLIKTSVGSPVIYDFKKHEVLFSRWTILRAFGYDPEEFKEVSRFFFKKIIHPEDEWAIEHHIQKLKLSKPGERLSLNLRIQDKQGAYRWIHIRDAVLTRTAQGEINFVICSVVDATQHRIRKKQIDLHASRMDFLSYRNAHELRSPVASILGLVALLKSKSRTQECMEEIFQLLEDTALKMEKAIREFDNELKINHKQLKRTFMDFQNIADNHQYTISVNREKNRAYLKIKGYWRNLDLVPNYLQDWRKALVFLKKDFTLLTDASEMKTHPQDVRILHEQAQALLVKNGVSRIAELVKDDIAEIQLNAMAKKTQLPKRNFKLQVEAEAWLD